MSMYIHTPTMEYPLYEGDIKLRFPQISWARTNFEPPEEYQPVIEIPVPEFDPITAVCEQAAPTLVSGNWYQRWSVTPLDAETIATNRANAVAAARNAAKVLRQQTVDAIRVTVNGKIFDGDETSQGRMARAIIGMQAAGQSTLTWVLADNTPTEATLAELTEALCLAGAAQAAVWVIPE